MKETAQNTSTQEVAQDQTVMTPEPTPEETSLATQDPNHTPAGLGRDDFFDSMATRRMWYGTIDPNDKMAGLAIVAAIDDTDFQIGDCLGTVIEVVNVAAHETVIETKDKGRVTAIRTVLIDKDGKSYGSVAEGVRDSIANLFAMVGMPPWSEPIRLTPVNKTTRNGFKTLKLIPKVDIK
jgi:hypothetical protein